MKVVKITWVDSCCVGESANPDLITQVSVGYLFEQTPRKTVLARDYYLEKYHYFLVIPTPNVTEIKVLEDDNLQKSI